MELAISIAANVLLGLLLLALLSWKGRRDGVRLSGADQGMELFRMHFPDAAGTATVAADRRSALVELQDGRIGLLERRGRRWNARMLTRRELSRVELERDGAIQLSFLDFGWPRATFRAADEEAQAQWMARLTSLTPHG